MARECLSQAFKQEKAVFVPPSELHVSVVNHHGWRACPRKGAQGNCQYSPISLTDHYADDVRFVCDINRIILGVVRG